MFKYLTATLTTFIITLDTTAQTVENTIMQYGENFGAEKIHVHFDKDIYLPGETVWFKAYVFEENLPTQRSTNLYISLYDETGKAVQQNICPIINATANGHFAVPITFTAPQLICRAYTAWMLNFDSSFIFTKTIKLFTGNTDTVQQKLTSSLQFFAEGGDIIEGERNTIAFKAVYSNGLPYNFEGIIKKQQTAEVITTIKTQHDGMGRFDIQQVPGENYYAEWPDNNGVMQKTSLPEKKINGVSLKMVQQKGSVIYNVVNRLKTDTLHVLAYLYQKIIYKASLPVPFGQPYTGRFPVIDFPAGVMQFTVFDNNHQPVAERICFINNNNYTTPVTISSKETTLKKRGKNIIELEVTDTLPANISLSITDADFNNEENTGNIFTSMLLNADLRGYIHNPAYYFKNTTIETANHLDLVMLTNGWRRYNWENIIAGKMPVINTPQDDYLALYGQINGDIISKLKKDEKINLIVKTKDSTSNYYFVNADAKGLLKTTGLIFYDTARVYYSFNNEKQYNKQLVFSNTNLLLNQPNYIANQSNWLTKDISNKRNTTTLQQFYTVSKTSNTFNNEKTMQAVVVKSGGWRNWKNSPIAKLDQRYASGMFSSGANTFALDLINNDKAWAKLDIFNYIRNAIPGLTVGSFNAISGRPLSYIAKPVLVYIDEQEMTSSDLENISIESIAYVKLIPNFMGKGMDAGGNSINPALAIYRKKGADLIDRTPKESDLGMVKIAGYTPLKEFYMPDYAENKNITYTDARTTLLWTPYILTDKNSLKIPVIFYTNDISKRIKIIVEGINEDGKLIHIEKIIE